MANKIFRKYKHELTMITQVILLLILGSLFLGFVSADSVNITNQTGETWIRWEWDQVRSIDILVDGLPFADERTNPNYIIVGELPPTSPHQILIVDSSTHAYIADSETWTTGTTTVPDNFADNLKTLFTNPFILLLISWLAVIMAMLTWVFIFPAILFGSVAAIAETATNDDPIIKIAFWFSWLLIWIVIYFRKVK